MLKFLLRKQSGKRGGETLLRDHQHLGLIGQKGPRTVFWMVLRLVLHDTRGG